MSAQCSNTTQADSRPSAKARPAEMAPDGPLNPGIHSHLTFETDVKLMIHSMARCSTIERLVSPPNHLRTTHRPGPGYSWTTG